MSLSERRWLASGSGFALCRMTPSPPAISSMTLGAIDRNGRFLRFAPLRARRRKASEPAATR
jgi:hypothetical protein